MKSLIKSISLLFLVIGVFACAAPYGSFIERDYLNDRTVVQVDNQSWDDMQIYLVSNSGQRIYVGRIDSTTKQTFVLKSKVASGPHTFHLKILAGSTWETYEFMTSNGDEIQLTVAHEIKHTHISVFPMK